MNVNKICSIFFSPVFHTAGISRILAQKLASLLQTDIHECDITLENFSIPQALDEKTVAIIGAPVYGGRVPATAVERLRKIQAQGSPAIIFVDYGNRAYEDALLELKNTAMQTGFKPFAAAACIAQHTIVPQCAQGRPDREDIQRLDEFTGLCSTWLERHPIQAIGELSVPGDYPYRDFKSFPLPQSVDDNCVLCGTCVKSCPVKAINPDDISQVDKETCICCMRCVNICPVNARHASPAFLEMVSTKLAKFKNIRRQNEFFIAHEAFIPDL